MSVSEKRADVLNSLIRAELAAVETYRQAAKELGPNIRGEVLTELQGEHVKASEALRQHVEALTDERAEDDSGAWGVWMNFLQGTANVFGDVAAVKALREGEESVIDDYEDALKSTSLAGECRELIQKQLLPRARQNLRVLEQVLETL